MSLAEASTQLANMAAQMQQLALDHPGWTVEPNRLRNWAVLDDHDQYIGFIDMIQGVVEIEPVR